MQERNSNQSTSRQPSSRYVRASITSKILRYGDGKSADDSSHVTYGAWPGGTRMLQVEDLCIRNNKKESSKTFSGTYRNCVLFILSAYPIIRQLGRYLDLEEDELDEVETFSEFGTKEVFWQTIRFWVEKTDSSELAVGTIIKALRECDVNLQGVSRETLCSRSTDIIELLIFNCSLRSKRYKILKQVGKKSLQFKIIVRTWAWNSAVDARPYC